MTELNISPHIKTILFVDDEPTTLIIGQFLIEELGYDFIGVENSQEALRIFQSDPDKFDLVITDFLMPYLKGNDLSREVQTVRSNMPVILLTGIYDFDKEQMKSDGISEIIYKPYEPNDLIAAINRCLNI